jgi:hypothetical protein
MAHRRAVSPTSILKELWLTGRGSTPFFLRPAKEGCGSENDGATHWANDARLVGVRMTRLLNLLSMSVVVALLAASVAAASAQSELDQENANTSSNFLYPVPTCFSCNQGDEQKLGQVFTAGKTGALDKVSVYMENKNTIGGHVAGSVLVEVRSVIPSGSYAGTPAYALKGWGIASYSGEQSPPRWLDVQLSDEAPVVAGTKYALTFSPVAQGDTWDDGYYLFFISDGEAYDSYKSGYGLVYHTGAWRMDANRDLLFKTYVSPDFISPEGTVLINDGERRTANRWVLLTLGAADPSPGTEVESVRIKNAGRNWTAWQPYAGSKVWKLTRAAGKKTVYVQYKDAAGNVSAKVSDSITYRP